MTDQTKSITNLFLNNRLLIAQVLEKNLRKKDTFEEEQEKQP